jgi:hypothetical protein
MYKSKLIILVFMEPADLTAALPKRSTSQDSYLANLENHINELLRKCWESQQIEEDRQVIDSSKMFKAVS